MKKLLSILLAVTLIFSVFMTGAFAASTATPTTASVFVNASSVSFEAYNINGNFAIVELENKLFANMPKSLVPQGAKEGSVLSIEIDEKETEKREQYISELFEQIDKNEN